jgi:hypothetical protein
MTGSQPKKPSKSSLSAAERLRERVAERLKTAAAKAGEAKTPLSRALRDCRVDALEVQLTEAVSAHVERAAALGAPVPSLALPPQVSARRIGKAAEKALARGQQARAEAEKKSEHRAELKRRLQERRAQAASFRAEKREARAQAKKRAQEQREANRRATDAAKRALSLPVSAPATPPRSGLVRLDKNRLTPQIVSDIPSAAPALAVAPKGKTEMSESAEARSASVSVSNLADDVSALEAFAKKHEPEAWAGYQALLDTWSLTFKRDGSIGAFHDAAPWQLREYAKPLSGTAVGRLISLKTAQYDRAEAHAENEAAERKRLQEEKSAREVNEKMGEWTKLALQIIDSLPSDWKAKGSLKVAEEEALAKVRYRPALENVSPEAYDRARQEATTAIRKAASEKKFDPTPQAAPGEPGYGADEDGKPTYYYPHKAGKKFSVLLPNAFYHWNDRSHQWEFITGIPSLTHNQSGAALGTFERTKDEKDLSGALRRAVKSWKIAEKAPPEFSDLLTQHHKQSLKEETVKKLGSVVRAVRDGETPDWSVLVVPAPAAIQAEAEARLARGKRLLNEGIALLTPNKYYHFDEIKGALKLLQNAATLYQQARKHGFDESSLNERHFNKGYARKFNEILADYKEIAVRRDRDNRHVLESAGERLREDAARISKLGIDSDSQDRAMTIHETSPKYPQTAPHIGIEERELSEILLPSDEGPQSPEKDRYGMVRSHPFRLKWDGHEKSRDYLEGGRKELQKAYNDYRDRVQHASVKEKTADLRDAHRGITEVAS